METTAVVAQVDLSSRRRMSESAPEHILITIGVSFKFGLNLMLSVDELLTMFERSN